MRLKEEQLNVSRTWRDFKSGLVVVESDETICTGEMLFKYLAGLRAVKKGINLDSASCNYRAPNVTYGTVFSTRPVQLSLPDFYCNFLQYCNSL